MKFFDIFKRKPVPMQTVDLQELCAEIYQRWRDNAPCTRAHLPLMVAVRTPGAQAFAYYNDLMEWFRKPVMEEFGWLKTVEIPAKFEPWTDEYFNALAKTIDKVIKTK